MDVGRVARNARDNVLADLLGKAVLTLLALAAGALFVLIKDGATVPAWTLIAVVALAAGAWLALSRRMTTGEQLAWFAVDIEEQYLQHLAQTLDTLQHVLTDSVDHAAIRDYVNHGILAPAKDMLTRNPDDHIRLSILYPHGTDFRMRFQAGHNLTSAKKFAVPMRDSISRVAFESGETETWDDVGSDDRYRPHPMATRPTRAMVSVPLTQGDQVIGVFNAISDRAGGFNPADRLYVECLGSVIDVAIGILQHEEAAKTTGRSDTVDPLSS